jgi:hypothetical protein
MKTDKLRSSTGYVKTKSFESLPKNSVVIRGDEGQAMSLHEIPLIDFKMGMTADRHVPVIMKREGEKNGSEGKKIILQIDQ